MNYEMSDEMYERLEESGSDSYMKRVCSEMDEILSPILKRLAVGTANSLASSLLSLAARRVEASIRRRKITNLGALALDDDVRHLVSYGRGKLASGKRGGGREGILSECEGLARLVDISAVMNAEDVQDCLEDLRVLSKEDAKKYAALKVADN